jgi:hypothetical protein
LKRELIGGGRAWYSQEAKRQGAKQNSCHFTHPCVLAPGCTSNSHASGIVFAARNDVLKISRINSLSPHEGVHYDRSGSPKLSMTPPNTAQRRSTINKHC